jgi:hypothetical protein
MKNKNVVPLSNNMKLFIGWNGIGSAHIILFAPDEEKAREIAESYIEEEGLKKILPCLDFDVHEVNEGVIEAINSYDFIYI